MILAEIDLTTPTTTKIPCCMQDTYSGGRRVRDFDMVMDIHIAYGYYQCISLIGARGLLPGRRDAETQSDGEISNVCRTCMVVWFYRLKNI